MSESHISIEDWQTAAAGMDKKPIRFTVSDSASQHLLDSGDGRSICIEVQDGEIRIVSHCPASDAPLVVTIRQDGFDAVCEDPERPLQRSITFDNFAHE